MAAALATFGAGCFWGVEAAFLELEGVDDAVSGYSGGTMENPTYQAVCTDTTGHVEVVQVSYDPEAVSYEQLLERFWSYLASKIFSDISFSVFEIPFVQDYDLYQMHKSYLYKGNLENAKGSIRKNL